MSVSLLQAKQAAKIANSFESEETQRNIWYAYISNVTSYNVQYRENQPIDYKGWEETEEKYDNINEAIDELSHLLYNAYTNAGNYFCPEHSLDGLIKMTKEYKSTDAYKEYQYEINKHNYELYYQL